VVIDLLTVISVDWRGLVPTCCALNSQVEHEVAEIMTEAFKMVRERWRGEE
jgi:hypothetical protein